VGSRKFTQNLRRGALSAFLLVVEPPINPTRSQAAGDAQSPSPFYVVEPRYLARHTLGACQRIRVAMIRKVSGGKHDEAVELLVGGGGAPWWPRLSIGCVPTPCRAGVKNRSCTLLPKLLPNAVGQAVTETEGELSGAQVIPTNWGV
jgi:hypothetical protein